MYDHLDTDVMQLPSGPLAGVPGRQVFLDDGRVVHRAVGLGLRELGGAPSAISAFMRFDAYDLSWSTDTSPSRSQLGTVGQNDRSDAKFLRTSLTLFRSHIEVNWGL